MGRKISWSMETVFGKFLTFWEELASHSSAAANRWLVQK
jgi:hypothetical protein